MKPRVTALLVLISLCMISWKPWSPPTSGILNLNLTVLNHQGKPMTDTEVEFIETQTRERVLTQTDKTGKLSHRFESGQYWQINIKDIRNYYFWQVQVKPKKSYTMNKTITYSYKRYERETRAVVDRSKLNIKVIAQNNNGSERADRENGIIRMEIKKADKKPLSNFPIAITSYKLRSTWTTKTNAGGIAFFKVPINNEYDVDIDGIHGFQFADLPNAPGARITRRFTYQPTDIQETNVNDTITQTLVPNQKGTTGSVITRVTFRNTKTSNWANEPVFLEVLGEKKWYRATTNARGQARFLLPKGKRYMIHGRFEYDLDVLDFTRRRGIGYSDKTVSYRPKAKYQFPEKFIPKPEELIVNAFQDFLNKQFPKPQGDAALRATAEFGPVNQNSKEAVLRLGIQAGDYVDHRHAPPLNISFVLDKSGSMAGHDRIGNLKESLMAFVNKLRPEDRVSLVIFENFETVIIEAQRLGDDRQHLKVAIRNIEAGGGTNIYTGMMAGYKEIMKNYKPGQTNRLILLTDGFGVTPIDEMLAAQAPYSAKGVEVSCVGVGQDYNYALLKQLAQNGGGLIEHVGEAKDLKQAFMRHLSDLLFPVAQNVEITVLYNKHLRYKHLYGAPVKERAGNRLRMKLRNAYGGQTQMAFLRFELPNASPEIAAEPVTVRLKYKDLRTGKMVVDESQVRLEWKEGGQDLSLVMDREEKKLYAIAVMNQSLKVMSDKFHSGDVEAAEAALRDGLKSLEKALPGTADEDLTTLKAELEKYMDVLKRQ
ncbi:MAG: VWA domain-containing protein [Bacteroidota bacterium]